MPKANINDMVAGLFEPIEFELDGVSYVVPEVPQELAEELVEKATGGDMAGVRNVLAKLCSVDAKVFKHTGFHKVMAAAMYVARTLTDQTRAFLSKNAPREGVESGQ